MRRLLLALAIVAVACDPSPPAETSSSARPVAPPTAKTVDVTTLQRGVAGAPAAWLDGLRLYVDGYVGTIEAAREGARKRTVWLRATPEAADAVSCDLANVAPAQDAGGQGAVEQGAVEQGARVRLSGVPRPLSNGRVRLVMCRFER